MGLLKSISVAVWKGAGLRGAYLFVCQLGVGQPPILSLSKNKREGITQPHPYPASLLQRRSPGGPQSARPSSGQEGAGERESTVSSAFPHISSSSYSIFLSSANRSVLYSCPSLKNISVLSHPSTSSFFPGSPNDQWTNHCWALVPEAQLTLGPPPVSHSLYPAEINLGSFQPNQPAPTLSSPLPQDS